VKDHQPLVTGCREIEALKEMLKRKQDVRVILELDAAEDGMRESIELLRVGEFASRQEKAGYSTVLDLPERAPRRSWCFGGQTPLNHLFL
jgi:hypothetical protein